MTLCPSHCPSWSRVCVFLFISCLCRFKVAGIPKITGTSELFDAHPAIAASYNVILAAAQPQDEELDEEDQEHSEPPLLFAQFERFLLLIKKYFLLCEVTWYRVE